MPTGKARKTLKREAALTRIVEAENPITVRGVFYRAVAAGLVEKTENGYKRISDTLTDMRAEGTMDWRRIADNSRPTYHSGTSHNAEKSVARLARDYRRSKWQNMDVRVEILMEKDTLANIIRPVTREYDVPLVITRGYSSHTIMREIAQRITNRHEEGITTYLHQFGDRDADGDQQYTALIDRLAENVPDGAAYAQRVALYEHQIIEWELPTRPPNNKGSRKDPPDALCAELDAVPTPQLQRLMRDTISQHVDPDEWQRQADLEADERDWLERLIRAA